MDLYMVRKQGEIAISDPEFEGHLKEVLLFFCTPEELEELEKVYQWDEETVKFHR